MNLLQLAYGIGIKYVLPRALPQLFQEERRTAKAPYVRLSIKDKALLTVIKKDGSVTVVLGSRDLGKTEVAYRWAEVLGRRTYAVSPEQKPPAWIERITLGQIDQVHPWSTLICDDLPAYASNRDYNNQLVQHLERIVPLCRHDRKLHLIFCSQSSAQADKYILDCDIAFFKPLGILMEDVERPNIRRIYRYEVNPYFEGKSEDWIKRHVWIRSRGFIGGFAVKMVPKGRGEIQPIIEVDAEENQPD